MPKKLRPTHIREEVMKKIAKYLMFFMALFAMSALALTSCSKDKESDDESKQFLGSWKYEGVLFGQAFAHIYTFKDNGSFVFSMTDQSGYPSSENGDWSYGNGLLTLQYHPSGSVTYMVSQINSTRMTWIDTEDGSSMILNKI